MMHFFAISALEEMRNIGERRDEGGLGWGVVRARAGISSIGGSVEDEGYWRAAEPHPPAPAL